MVSIHQEGEYRPIDSSRGLYDIREHVLLRFRIEICQVCRRVRVQALSLRVDRLLGMGHQIKVRSISDPLQFVPLLLFVCAVGKEPVLKIDSPLRVVGEFLARLLVLSYVLLLHSEREIPVITGFDPPLVPLFVVRLVGLENSWRLDEVFNLHLLEFPRPEYKIPRRDLIAKRLADLSYSKRQFLVRRIQHVLEIYEYSLGCLGPQVSQAGLVLDRPNGSPKHQVELARFGQVRGATLGAFAAFDLVGP